MIKNNAYTPLLFLTLIFLGLSLFFSSSSYKRYHYKKKVKALQEFIHSSQVKSENTATLLFDKDVIELSDLAPFHKDDVTILYAEKDSLIEWSNNLYIPSLEGQLKRKKNKTYFQPSNEHWYFIQSFTSPPSRSLFFVYELTNHEITKANSLFGDTRILSFSESEKDGSFPIIGKNGNRLTNVEIINKNKSNTLLEISWISFITLTFFTLYHFFKAIKGNPLIVSNSILLLICLVNIKELLKADPVNVLDDIEIFQPSLFANPNIGSSLGVLIINFLIIAFTLYLWYQRKPNFSFYQKLPRILRIIAISVAFGFTYCLMSYTCKSLILDSYPAIANNPFSTRYTLIVFTLLFFAVLNKFVVDLRFIRYVKRYYSFIELILVLLLTTIVTFAILNYSYEEHSVILFLAIWQIISLIALFLLLENKDQKIKQISGIVLYFTVFAFFCAQTLHYYSNKKKNDQLLQTARKLSNDEDTNAMFEIDNIRQEILQDTGIPKLLASPFLDNETIRRRIENLYITDEISDYNINYEFGELTDTIKISDSSNSNSNYKQFEYSIQLPFYEPNNRLITINFKRPKIDLTESYYNSLNNLNNRRSHLLQEQLSYAVYNNEKLSFLEGNINEPDWNKIPNLDIGGSYTIRDKDVTKMVFKKDELTTLLLSNKEPTSGNELLFLFTNFFGFLFFCFLLFVLFISGFNLTRFSFFKNSLANQIQFLVILFLYLAGFIVTYISMQVSRGQLLETEQANYEQFSNNLFIDYESETDPKERTIESLKSYLEKNVLGSPNDFHLFDKKGRLRFTNNSKLFRNNSWPERIHPEVLYEFNENPIQSYIRKEKIGSNKYYGFYRAVRLNGLDLDGAMYLPALDIKRTVDQQRNLIVSSQFNAFSTVLFILTFFSLIISQSLTNILFKLRRRFSEVDFGEKKKFIEWENEDEIGDLVQEYNAMVKKLDENAVLLARSERESAWRDVAKQIAHEIKNPLTPMKLSIQHLKRRVSENDNTEIDEAILKTLNSLEQQTQHLSKIADNFSSIAKMELPTYRKIDLVLAIEEIIPLYKNQEDYLLFFSNNLSPSTNTIISADKTMLSRVLNNLLKNAQQALVEERIGQIEVKLDEDERTFIITVQDNGKGIDSKNRAKIFTPNFTTKSSGTGIGLMMSKKMIELHKGTISFESTKGEGTIFTITLPKLLTRNEES